jgi:hypothetical protein
VTAAANVDMNVDLNLDLAFRRAARIPFNVNVVRSRFIFAGSACADAAGQPPFAPFATLEMGGL